MASLGTVTLANLFNQSWSNIYKVIDDNVSDPKSRAKWIYAAFPQERKGTVDVYPCIVIESPDAKDDNFVMGARKMYTWNIQVSVYDTKMGSLSATEIGLDRIASSVLNQLEINKGSLKTQNMNDLNLVSSPTFHNIIGGQVVHEKRITIDCEGSI